MDLDNINDIEVLRKIAKSNRIQLKKDVNSTNGDYIFKKGFWYFMEQYEDGISIFSDNYVYKVIFTYEEAEEYL